MQKRTGNTPIKKEDFIIMKIIKVKKDSDGEIQAVLTDTGKVFSVEEAIELTKDRKIEGVNVGAARNGRETLRSNADGIEENNLSNLPTFD